MDYLLFSDASFSPKSGTGALAFTMRRGLDDTAAEIHTRVLNGATGSQLEILSAIWAFEYFFSTAKVAKLDRVILYTDCQTVAGLPTRRKKLEARDFKSRRTGELLNNGDLYRKFYLIYDRFRPAPEIIWIKGHSERSGRSAEAEIFAAVDREARRVVRGLGAGSDSDSDSEN